MIEVIQNYPLSTEARLLRRFGLFPERIRISDEFASTLLSPEKQHIYEEGNALCDKLMQEKDLNWPAPSEEIQPILNNIEEKLPGYKEIWVKVDTIGRRIALSGDDGEFLNP